MLPQRFRSPIRFRSTRAYARDASHAKYETTATRASIVEGRCSVCHWLPDSFSFKVRILMHEHGAQLS